MNFAEFCNQFTRQPRDVVKIGRRYFHDPMHLLAKYGSMNPASVGVYLGEERGNFRPTSALINLLAEGSPKVSVNERAAWLFLCGKNILMEGVEDADPVKKNDLVIIADSEGNTLGYGQVSAAFKSGSRQQFVKNLLDKGEYLRRE